MFVSERSSLLLDSVCRKSQHIFVAPQGKLPLTGMVVNKSEETRNTFELSGE